MIGKVPIVAELRLFLKREINEIQLALSFGAENFLRGAFAC